MFDENVDDSLQVVFFCMKTERVGVVCVPSFHLHYIQSNCIVVFHFFVERCSIFMFSVWVDASMPWLKNEARFSLCLDYSQLKMRCRTNDSSVHTTTWYG